jgi:endonuclease-8
VPEGHLLHRYAAQLTGDLGGGVVRATSPQGRFDASAVDGAHLLAVQAHGKHLLHRFEDAPPVHVHLGLRGLYLRYEDLAVPPRGGVRLRLAGPSVAWDLIAPTSCEVLDEDGVAKVLGRLGPDPLGPGATSDEVTAEAVRRLRGARGPVGAAVLDQAVWAGVGNAWRAELLFLARLDPATPAAQVPEDAAALLWRTTCALFARGRDAGQVVSDPDAPDERWVYKRQTCRSCGSPVRTGDVGGRTAYWCPVEQPG